MTVADSTSTRYSSLNTAALNIGRDDVSKDNDDDIYGCQWSGILDDKVGGICLDLDGCVAANTEYKATVWMQPIHFWDRCTWVAIMNDEEDPPAYTGIPSNPGVASNPSLSRIRA